MNVSACDVLSVVTNINITMATIQQPDASLSLPMTSRPERTLNDYNVFFLLERELFYQEKGIRIGQKLNSDHDLRLYLQYGTIADSFPPRPTRYESLELPNFWFLKKTTSNRRSKSKGAAAADGLSRLIASKWKTCDREVKAYVSVVARIVKSRRDAASKARNDAVRLIQNTRANPSFRSKVKRVDRDWVDGYYGVQLQTMPSSASPYFQSDFKSRTSSCDSELRCGQRSDITSLDAFASGTSLSQQIVTSMRARAATIRENIYSLHTHMRSHTAKETYPNRKDTKAVYGRAFVSHPPNNMPMIAHLNGMELSLSSSESSRIHGKSVCSNMKEFK